MGGEECGVQPYLALSMLHTTWYLLTGVSEVPDVRFVGSAQNVTEAEGMMTVCVVSGQLAEEIIPVNATISTQAGSAKGQQSHSRCPLYFTNTTYQYWPHPQAPPIFYLAAVEKNREKAWDQNYVTNWKW